MSPESTIGPVKKTPNRTKEYARCQVVMTPEEYEALQRIVLLRKARNNGKYTMSQMFMDLLNTYLESEEGSKEKAKAEELIRSLNE